MFYPFEKMFPYLFAPVYILTDYSLVIFRSVHCYRSGLTTLTRMQNFVVV